MDATVAICTRNRAPLVRRLLQGLALQRAEIRWDVLVVANDCDDDTASVVEALAAGFPVPLRIEHEPQRGLAHARNRALDTARGALLLFLDDDVTCRPGWLAAHVAAFGDPRVVGTGGRILPVLPEGAPGWFRAESLERIGGPATRYDFGDAPLDVGALSRRPPPFGANMGMRRVALASVGRFRTDLGWGRVMIPGEETELMNRLEAAGGRLVYVPDATIDHHIDLARCNREYFTRWYRGLGRAAIRSSPPASRLERLGLAASASRQLVRAWLRRGSRRGAKGYASALRKSALARGQLDELLS
jgi:glycosyltransferase involved in cell wall biosynthesis